MLLVDARQTWCPVPILRLAQAARGAVTGDELELLATDPAVRSDLPAWCASTGHELVSLEERGGAWRGVVRIRGAGVPA
ncbi:MAG TPA: sulfurtransferase TusA family protein [Myxococcaceae bacterium]|jgi:tRNA 2-thiouridine synthesizing protein A